MAATNSKSTNSKSANSSQDNSIPINILVIDDDQDICGFVRLLLEKKGYIVETLNDASNTIKVLKENTFHIVLLDLVMPGVNGMDLLNDIRRTDGDLAVVIITGYPSVETAVESLQQHSASAYLSKPFTAKKLEDTIEEILRKKGLLVSAEEMLHTTIGNIIRVRRKQRGLTLKQLNKRTGLSVSLLSQIERAESSASVSSLLKISLALDCRLTDLFGSF